MCVRIKHNCFPTIGFTDRFEFTNGTTAGYDNLDRLLNFSRGTLASGNNTISSPTATRSWSLDAQGNWGANAAGQPYTINNQNQITLASGSPSATFGYDNDGNLTSRPAPAGSNASANDAFAYDAWDREAQFTRTFVSSGGSEIEVAANIDALGRRTQVVTTGTGGLGGVPLPTDDLYYSTSWQVLEDDNSKTANGGANTGFNQMQFVWSPTYVNDLVLRDRSTAGNGSFNERVYVQHDANHNVTAITDVNGVVKERFVYDPYGVATVLNPTTWAIITDTYNWQYTFQGGRYDSNSGLYTYQRREYDPALGRWIEQDPARDINGANLQQFVESSPIDLADPTGLKWYNGWIDAIPALVGLAQQPVQDTFDQSVFDRTNGTLDNLNRRLYRFDRQLSKSTCGAIDRTPIPVEPFTFDPANRASADDAAGVIINTAEAAVAVAGLGGAAKGIITVVVKISSRGAATVGVVASGAISVSAGVGAVASYDLSNDLLHPSSGAPSSGGSGNNCRNTNPIGNRNRYNTRKGAYEAAKRAGRGAEPIHHPDGEFGPHFHPDVPMPPKGSTTPHGPNPHDHYYY